MKSRTKQLFGWIMYDWANSAFALTVMAAFFPGVFKNLWSAGVDNVISTARLGFGNAAGGLVVAILSPILGALASVGRAKKRGLMAFATLGVGMTALLYFVGEGSWLMAMGIFILARIGFSIGNLFYDSLLIDVTEGKDIDMVSSKGYAYGYLGCGILFLLNLMMYKYPHTFGFSDAGSAARFAFITAAIWWLVFTVPLWLWVKEKGSTPVKKFSELLASGMYAISFTFRDIRSDRRLLFFLVAFWCYNDGVHAFVMMATDFGLSLGFEFSFLMVVLLVVQFVAFPMALVFGLVSRKLGEKYTLFIAIAMYTMVCLVGARFLRTETHFLILACITGSAQGGIQALSRSLFSRMIDPLKSSQFFGFYYIVGKFSVILGPAIVAAFGLMGRGMGLSMENSTRLGIASLSLLFIAGGFFLSYVNVSGLKKERSVG